MKMTALIFTGKLYKSISVLSPLTVLTAVLLIAPSSPAVTSPPSEEDSKITFSPFSQDLDSAFHETQIQLHGNESARRALVKCQIGFRNSLSACELESERNPYCAAASHSLPDMPGLKKDLNVLNCAHALHHCFAYGSAGKDKSFETAQYDCLQAIGEVTNQPAVDALLQLNEIANSEFTDQQKTWQSRAERLENKLRSQLGAQLQCYGFDNLNRVCSASKGLESAGAMTPGGDGHFEFAGFSPGQMLFGCSGSLLGDGSTFVTAGHCTKDLGATGGHVDLRVFDVDGFPHNVGAVCVRGAYTYAGGGNPDVSVCRLDHTISAPQQYLAVLDRTAGEFCKPEGWILRCGLSFFSQFAGQTARVYGFPYFDGQEAKSPFDVPSRVEFNAESNSFTFQHWCTGGCSGAGIFVQARSRKIILTVISWESREEPQGGAAAIPADVWQRISTDLSHSTGPLAR